MSYAILGTNCTPRTIAWTDDNKFLVLDSPVYSNNFTTMKQYPLESSDDSRIVSERVKAFYSPYNDYNTDQSFVAPTQHKSPAKCKSCSSK